MDELHQWLTGLAVTILIFLLSIWYKQVGKSDGKIDSLKRNNDKAHKDIHDKMDGMAEGLHKSIIDLWKHRGDKK